ncbi:MAG: methionine biosynthesis protein MetW [Bryobacterales bacterium]|nr:methionine biosynthesis protein MetW [Bryobacterales bacterium]
MSETAEAQAHGIVPSLLGREDYAIISALVPEGAKVLDVGCGEGELLHWLVENKSVEGRGIELESGKVHKAISKGLSVYQGDINAGLTVYPDNAFDVVVLSQTLQETQQPRQVMLEMLRIGRKVVVTFPNFAHWSVRVSLLIHGKAPRTKFLPYSWYNSPNIRVLSIGDFEDLIDEESWQIERKIFLAGHRRITRWPNLFAEVAICLVTKR